MVITSLVAPQECIAASRQLSIQDACGERPNIEFETYLAQVLCFMHVECCCTFSYVLLHECEWSRALHLTRD